MLQNLIGDKPIFKSLSFFIFLLPLVHIKVILVKNYIFFANEAPNRSRAAGYLMTPCSTEVAVGMPCPSRIRAAGYND
jgi:hypothetical protein